MSAPTVAVLIPVWQDPAGFLTSLQSLAGQQADLEVIAVDDGSPVPLSTTDLPRLTFPVTILRQQRNQGIEAALNRGIEHIAEAGHTYIARLDAGDRCLAGRLEQQVTRMQLQPELALLGTGARFVAADGRVAFRHRPPVDEQAIRRAMRINCCFCHPTVMMRTAAVIAVGGYRTAYPAAEDYDLFMRLMAAGYATANLADELVETEYDPQGISLRRRRRQLASRLRIQMREFAPLEPASWSGIAKTLVLAATPQGVVRRLKTALMGGQPE